MLTKIDAIPTTHNPTMSTPEIARDLQYLEYQRVLQFAKDCSELKPDEDAHQLFGAANSSQFDFQAFAGIAVGFDSFLKQAQHLNLMISGSSVLFASDINQKLGSYRWKPGDIDIYIHAGCDQQMTIKNIDYILRNIYNTGYQIRLFRTPYILSWFIIETQRNTILLSYQVVLSPCIRWEHVFTGYHTDMLCAGYLCKQRQFVITSRFNYWRQRLSPFDKYKAQNAKSFYEKCHRTAQRSFGGEPVAFVGASYFFPDLVSPRYRDRVVNACEKYIHRGFPCILVQPFGELYIQDIERSSTSIAIAKLIQSPCDIATHILNLDTIERSGMCLVDVYQGETFASILETMSCFRQCPGGCGKFVIGYANSQNGYFCQKCQQTELSNAKTLKRVLKANSDLVALVTGSRCGLGQGMKEFFEKHQWTTYGTTRFVNLTEPNRNMIELDLKDPDKCIETQKLLEKGFVNVLVLSASETLHYPEDDHHPIRNDASVKDKLTFDWTNDFTRKNTGIWHKTLDQHTEQEIVSPLLANVAGTSRLLSSFLKGVKLVRATESLNPHLQKQKFACIVVTSFEGKFVDKTPFHPITNACKSAIEQIVFTVQGQAKLLECAIDLADPGWVYTDPGKTPGPVPIAFGISQILQPLVQSLGDKPQPGVFKVYRREHSTDYTLNVDSSQKRIVWLQLHPCKCIVKLDDFTYPKQNMCPACQDRMDSRSVYDFRPQITFLLIARSYGVCKDVIQLILRFARYPK